MLIIITKNFIFILITLIIKAKLIKLIYFYNYSYKKVYLGVYINIFPETRRIFFVITILKVKTAN